MKFSLRLPRDTLPHEAEAMARAVKHVRESKIRISDEEGFDRLQRINAKIVLFKTLIETSSKVCLSKEVPKSRFYHFSLKYDEFCGIAEHSDVEYLDFAMRTHGGYVSEKIFRALHGSMYDEYIASLGGAKELSLVGTVEIYYHSAQNTKSVCFVRAPLIHGESDGAMNDLLQVFPEMRSFLVENPAVRSFLKDPTSNPDMLRDAMEAVTLNDPCLAGQVQEELDALTKCASCGSGNQKLMQCQRCKKVRYCGRACQLDDWHLKHKSVCK